MSQENVQVPENSGVPESSANPANTGAGITAPAMPASTLAPPQAAFRPYPYGEPFAYNRVDRLPVRLGVIGALSGYRFAKALRERISELNREGRRVVAIYRNQWGLLRWAGAGLLAACTLSIVVLLPCALIISEPLERH